METKGALMIRGTAPGDVPTLVDPIPDFAYVSLPVFAMARIQEWLVWGSPADGTDAGTFDLCGHRFRVLGWSDSEKALAVAHTGTTPA